MHQLHVRFRTQKNGKVQIRSTTCHFGFYDGLDPAESVVFFPSVPLCLGQRDIKRTLPFGEFGANLISIWDHFDFFPKCVPASRQIQTQMCPHAAGVVPVGAQGFSYTFWCTCAAISYSCVSTMVQYSQVWVHF